MSQAEVPLSDPIRHRIDRLICGGIYLVCMEAMGGSCLTTALCVVHSLNQYHSNLFTMTEIITNYIL